MNVGRASLGLSFLLSLLPVSSLANVGTVTIHDQAFQLASWPLTNRSSSGVSASASRLAGAGVTGDARLISIGGLSAGRRYSVDQYFLDTAYNPATQGAAKSLTWELWYKYTGPSTWGSVYVIAKQGSQEFYAPNSYREPASQTSSWQKYSGGLSLGDFIPFAGSGPGALDYSSASPPIYFGYRCFSTIDLPSSVNHQASFFTVTISTAALTPATGPWTRLLLLVALGLAGSLAIYARSRRGLEGRA